MRSIGLFTIASKNYLSYVRTLLKSVSRVHPEYALFLCLADRIDGQFDPKAEPYSIVEAEQLGIPTFADMTLRYDIMEFNTAVKPFMFSWLFDHTELDVIIYLDPDIRAYSRFEALESRLEDGASIVLTPHITRPLEDGKKPGDHDILQAGVFNLGFIAVRRHLDSRRFIDWWSRRLLSQCVADFGNNLFVDQRWCDLAPCFVDDLCILKHPGYNVAYWNLSQRIVDRNDDGSWSADGGPLVFFHFSGVKVEDKTLVSKHQDRLKWREIAACQPLFEQYRGELLDNGWNETRGLPYAYGSASRQLAITTTMRQLYRTTYPEPIELNSVNLERYLIELCNHLAEGMAGGTSGVVTRLMHLIYRSRADLQQAFQLSNADGRRAFIAWFAESAQREYGLPEFLCNSRAKEQSEPVSDPWPSRQPSLRAYALLTALDRMVLARIYRRLPESLRRPAKRYWDQAIDWSLRHDVRPQDDGGHGLPLLDQPATIRQLLTNHAISNLMHIVWLSRPDLRRAFSLDTPSGQEQFVHWYQVSVKREYGLDPRVLGPGAAAAMPAKQVTGDPGANLIGYARAELGLGEHLRQTAAALATTDLDFGILDFSVGVSSRKQAKLPHGKLISRNRYKANVFHITADRMLTVLCHLGRPFFHRRFNILYPFWELPNWPDEWVPVTDMFDEIWAPSTFIQRAISAKTGLTVRHMPPCVAPSAPRSHGRAHFRLPERWFLFLFSFDFFSFIDRKNPFATIRAFKKAFPGRNDVGLVLKVMNGDAASTQWARMIELIGGDPRIFVLNATMDRDEMLDLYSVADCYISLHRSEGFGLGLAESMYLGKPVIATNYSGNTDFTKPDNACLVDFRLIPVEPGQYVYEHGQEWADPDLDQAAWYMARIASDEAYRSDLGERGRAFIHENLSPRTIGRNYRTRLRELGLG